MRSFKIGAFKVLTVALLALLVLSVMPSYAIKTLSLEECVEIALKNDPNVRLATEHKNISKSKVGQAKSDYFPSLNAGTGYNYQSNNASGSYSANSNANTYQVNFGVNQLIWNFGRTSAKINMQKYNHEASGYDLEQVILNTTYRVKMAYFEVLAALAGVDISQRTVEINKLHYERTKALFEEGLKSKIDVVNAEVNLTDAEIQLLNSQTAHQNAMISLSNAMYYIESEKFAIKNTENFNFAEGTDTVSKNIFNISFRKDNKTDAVLKMGVEKNNILKNYTFTPFKMSAGEAIDAAYKNRPDLQSLVLVKRAQEEALKVVKSSYLPALSADAGYSARKNYDADSTNGSFSVSAGLDFPLINGMNIKHQIDEGKSYLKIAEENVDLLKKNIYFEIQNNYVNMVQLEKKIPLLENKVRYTLENFELADGRYNVGLGNFIELQDAQQNYNNAQLALVKCVFDYNVAREMLQKSMGVK